MTITDMPHIGDFVTVTTRFKSNRLDKEYDVMTFKEVPVTRINEFPNSFTVKGDLVYPGFTLFESVIPIKRIIELKIHREGHLDKNVQIPQESLKETVIVQGSLDNKYTVVFENGTPVSCTCPGFYYRQHCKHLLIAKTQKEK